MPSRSRKYWPMLYAVRLVLADKPTTAQVAGVVSNRLITSGSRHVLTAQILADTVGGQPRGPSPGPESVASDVLKSVPHHEASWDFQAADQIGEDRKLGIGQHLEPWSEVGNNLLLELSDLIARAIQ
jgi:hypothetical protein